MVSFAILAGGYDVFVATYLFNSATCSLTLQSKSPTGSNPSWITLDPNNRKLLYAVNENPAGALQSFSINSNGTLSKAVDTVASGGDGPAFATALSTGAVAVLNYGSGNGRIISTTSHGATFEQAAQTITFPPPAGGVSHPHMALQYRNEIFVPDLGADQIWRLRGRKNGSDYHIQGSIPQPTGSGPRHIAIYHQRLFTLHETTSTLSVQNIPPPPNGTVTTFDTVSIIPPNPPPGAKYAAAEILIPRPSAKFPKPYIYVSNRNIGVPTTQGDSIAIFEHVNQGRPNEGLVLVNQVFTGLDQIRGMEFGNGAGDEFLMAGAFAGTGGVIVLQRTDGGRNLKILVRNRDVATRTSFVWL